MALTGAVHISPQQLAVTSTNQEFPLGTQMVGSDGKVFIYLKGVASTAIGSWVTFDEAFATALLVADAKGAVAVAMSANVANQYGWYQMFGAASALTANDVADNGDVYGTATPGAADDAVVAGDRVKGALFRAARTGAGLVSVQLFNPYVDDIAD